MSERKTKRQRLTRLGRFRARSKYIRLKGSLGFPVWEAYLAGPLPDTAEKSDVEDLFSHFRSKRIISLNKLYS